MTPNGEYAYVANSGADNVSVISTATDSVISTISVSSYPNGVAITPNGQYAYIANSNGIVSVISISHNSVVANITLNTNTRGVVASPNGEYVYVVNNALDGMVSVISTATNSVVATIPVGSTPRSITISPNGQYVYVTNFGGDSISVISTISGIKCVISSKFLEKTLTSLSFLCTDKKAEDANTVKDIVEMYGQQKNISIKT